MARQSPPRLSVEITEHQYDELKRLLPQGTKTQIFGAIVDDLIQILDLANASRNAVLGSLMSRELRLSELWLARLREEEESYKDV